jgi:hypothetical protein
MRGMLIIAFLLASMGVVCFAWPEMADHLTLFRYAGYVGFALFWLTCYRWAGRRDEQREILRNTIASLEREWTTPVVLLGTVSLGAWMIYGCLEGFVVAVLVAVPYFILMYGTNVPGHLFSVAYLAMIGFAAYQQVTFPPDVERLSRSEGMMLAATLGVLVVVCRVVKLDRALEDIGKRVGQLRENQREIYDAGSEMGSEIRKQVAPLALLFDLEMLDRVQRERERATAHNSQASRDMQEAWEKQNRDRAGDDALEGDFALWWAVEEAAIAETASDIAYRNFRFAQHCLMDVLSGKCTHEDADREIAEGIEIASNIHYHLSGEDPRVAAKIARAREYWRDGERRVTPPQNLGA